ncbi:hypothetical protein [Kitasatospora aureofaciens]|uniref:hypothetical protein n=1 Tax=Kitasatospora aureofaciens TaxID=1894 RepID=UPI0036F45FC0
MVMADYWGVAIGTLGTLAGAAATGGFTLLKGRQDSGLKKLELAEQRNSRHRDIRRDAYAQFLAQLSKVDGAFKKLNITPIRSIAMSSDPNMIEEYEALVDELQGFSNVVYMEGPEAVANSAREITSAVKSLRDLTIDFIASRVADIPLNQQAIVEVLPEFGAAPKAEIDRLRQQFMLSAREIL